MDSDVMYVRADLTQIKRDDYYAFIDVLDLGVHGPSRGAVEEAVHDLLDSQGLHPYEIIWR